MFSQKVGDGVLRPEKWSSGDIILNSADFRAE